MNSSIQNIKITHKNKKVNGKKITVSSVLPITINDAWDKLQESKTLEFVAKNRVIFEPIAGHFPQKWEIGKSYQTKMKLYGFLPSLGIHNIFFESKDDNNFIIKTQEEGDSIKVWNHTMCLKKVNESQTEYTDKIVIYNGFTTPLMALWTKNYYKYRHQRWLELIRNQKNLQPF